MDSRRRQIREAELQRGREALEMRKQGRTQKEIGALLHASVPTVRKMLKVAQIHADLGAREGDWKLDLPPRVRSALHGLKVATKEELRSLLPTLRAGQHPNVGKGSIADLWEYFGESPPPENSEPSAYETRAIEFLRKRGYRVEKP